MADVVRYKDVVVSKGSALYEAIDNKKPLEAARIYWECEVEFQKHAKGTCWEKPAGLAQAELKKVLDKIEEIRKQEESKGKK